MNVFDIPDKYQPLDATVSDPNRFVDIYTVRRAKQNHNKALAARARRPILHTRVNAYNISSSQLDYIKTRSISSTTPINPRYAFLAPIMVSWPTRELTIHIEAQTSGASAAKVTPYFAHSSRPSAFVDANNGFSVNAKAWYSGNFSLPIELATQPYTDGFWYLGLLLENTMGSSPHGKVATSAITAAGSNWFRLSIADLADSDIGYGVVIDSDPLIEPRQLRAVSSDNYTGYVDQPWNRVPHPGDTVTMYPCNSLYLYTVCVWEAEVTSFNPEDMGNGAL